MSEEKKTAKVDFSEEIDGFISGLAVGFGFIITAAFILAVNPIQHIVINNVVAIGILICGLLGTSFEFNKYWNKRIKGIDDFVLSTIIVGVAVFLILHFDKLVLNIILIPVFFFGIYGFLKGMLEIVYSIYRNMNNPGISNKAGWMTGITFVSEIIALIVGVVKLVVEVMAQK